MAATCSFALVRCLVLWKNLIDVFHSVTLCNREVLFRMASSRFWYQCSQSQDQYPTFKPDLFQVDCFGHHDLSSEACPGPIQVSNLEVWLSKLKRHTCINLIYTRDEITLILSEVIIPQLTAIGVDHMSIAVEIFGRPLKSIIQLKNLYCKVVFPQLD